MDSKLNKNDNSLSIVTLAGEFKEIAELKEYCNKQFEFVEALTKEVVLLKERNAHLESLLTKSIPVINTNVVKLTDEEMICLEQIEKLKLISQNRELSLDEVKKLDLLHKNLKMTRQSSQDTLPVKKTDVTTQKLLEIVKKES